MNSDAKLTTSQIHEEQDSKALYGFWVYLMTDCVLFASMFASFAVLRGNIADGPSGHELFNMPYVLIETMLLLTSSFFSGLSMISAKAKQHQRTLLWLVLTFILGAAFLVMELVEFGNLVVEGHSWTTSAFLSSYFTLVGTHGLHITAGLIWMAVLTYRVFKNGINRHSLRRLGMLSLFWHFLDIVWIFIFSIVYLLGARG